MGQETRLDIPQSRQFAIDLLNQGQPAAARQVALTLIERDPKDRIAYVVLSRAERFLGDYKTAIKAGKTAWRLGETKAQKYTGALLTAQALSAADRKVAAQIWLRRAAQVAPTDFARDKAISDFRYVRSTNPIATRLNFSASPSSNINNGARPGLLEFGPFTVLVPDSFQALSGIEYRFTGSFDRRFRLSERNLLTVGAQLDARSYSLSSSAKSMAPTASASDYAFQELTFSTSLARRDKDGHAATTYGVALGQNWYGGDALTNFARASLTRRYALSPEAALNFGLTGERQWRQDQDARSATVWSMSAGYARRLSTGANLTLSAYASDSNSASAAIAHQRFGGEVRYAPSKPIFGKTQLELSLGYEARNYDRALPAFAVREDETIRLGATLVFHDIQYFGFSPTAELNAERTNSSVALYETEKLGLRLGLRSSF